MTPTMLIRVATAALVGAMFLPAQSKPESRWPVPKAAGAAEKAQVRLAEVMAMLQDDTLSAEQRAEATRKLEEVMAALAAATPAAGQEPGPARKAEGGQKEESKRDVVIVRSSKDAKVARDSQSAQDSQSSSSSSSDSSASKSTDEKSDAGKGSGRARARRVMPGGAVDTTPVPPQEPKPVPTPDSRPPKAPKAPKAPKGGKPPRMVEVAPEPPTVEARVLEVTPGAIGTRVISGEAPSAVLEIGEVVLAEPVEIAELELAEPVVISEESIAVVGSPESFTLRSLGEGGHTLRFSTAEPDAATLRAHVLELTRAKFDGAQAEMRAKLRASAALRSTEQYHREIDRFQEALQRAQAGLHRDTAAKVVERAVAERAAQTPRSESRTFEVRGQRARTHAQDEEIRALIDEMRAEMREIRALMREMRAHAGAAPAAGDRLLYVDGLRVDTTAEAIEAAKDAYGAGRPVRLRWAGEKVESSAPEATQSPRLRWRRVEEAPKAQCEEEEVEVSTIPSTRSDR